MTAQAEAEAAAGLPTEVGALAGPVAGRTTVGLVLRFVLARCQHCGCAARDSASTPLGCSRPILLLFIPLLIPLFILRISSSADLAPADRSSTWMKRVGARETIDLAVTAIHPAIFLCFGERCGCAGPRSAGSARASLFPSESPSYLLAPAPDSAGHREMVELIPGSQPANPRTPPVGPRCPSPVTTVLAPESPSVPSGNTGHRRGEGAQRISPSSAAALFSPPFWCHGL